ncbi:MAG: thiosulfate sulfurtransferase [Alphaproteobacteria bacterium]|nr:thiosulfate sulfurtransferase [Alphaproteobacteria bacterium]
MTPSGARAPAAAVTPAIDAPLVDAAELRAILGDGQELALLDVREEGAFARGHLLTAASLPLSKLETRIDALVPRRDARIVLVDDDENLARRALTRLRGFGYGRIAVLAGGIGAWKAAGHQLFSGVFVPSKAFGEVVEHRDGTPAIDATELKRLMEAGTDMVVLDSRPEGEFKAMSLPGGWNCPGAELVYRIHELVKRPETLVVVNCAGRTRSIIGAQSLINAGLPNKVVALRNGTMGWHLAGFALEGGKTRMVPPPGAEALAKAKAAAAGIARRFGIRCIGRGELERLRAEPARTTYCFDVRSPEEYAGRHLSGFRSAPGGQLVQATDTYAATRNARLVLADDDGVRATMTAHWLIQLGWPEVVTLDPAAMAEASETGPEIQAVLGLKDVPTIAPTELGASKDVAILDLATSIQYRKGHVPGARFAQRPDLAAAIAGMSLAQRIVLTSPDGVIARLAVPEVQALTDRPVLALAEGTAGWKAAGRALESGDGPGGVRDDDVYYRPYDRQAQIEEAMRDYLRWEIALADQVKREDYVKFPSPPV